MRIRKSPQSGSQGFESPTALNEHERLVWKDVDEFALSSNMEDAGQLYVRHVMKPLLGSKFVDAGVCCFHIVFMFLI